MHTGQRNIVLLCVEVQKILNATRRHRTGTKNFFIFIKKKLFVLSLHSSEQHHSEKKNLIAQMLNTR